MRYNKLTDDQEASYCEETYQVKNNKKESLSTKEKQVGKFHEEKSKYIRAQTSLISRSMCLIFNPKKKIYRRIH